MIVGKGDGGGEAIGSLIGIHRAVEIEWEGTDGHEFLLQKSSDITTLCYANHLIELLSDIPVI